MVSKVFEKPINNRIADYEEKFGLFPDFQYGVRSSRSTADYLKVMVPLYLYVNLSYSNAWNTVFMSGLVLLVVTWNC